MLQTSNDRKLPGERIKPKNGRYLVALLASGTPDQKEKLRAQWKNERGIWLQYHWEQMRMRHWQRSNVQTDVDVVLHLSGWTDHRQKALIENAADRANPQVPVFNIYNGGPAEMDKIFPRREPLDMKTLLPQHGGESSYMVETRLASLAERNAEIAELNSLLASLDDVRMDTHTTAVSPVDVGPPPVESVDIPLMATLMRLFELMGQREITDTIAHQDAGGGELTIKWKTLPPANDNAPKK